MSWMSSLICLMGRSWMLKDVIMFVSICSNIMTCLIVWISGLLLGFSIIVCVQKVWKLLSWWLGNFYFLKIWKSGNLEILKIWKFRFSEKLENSIFWKIGNSGNFGFLKNWNFLDHEFLENYIYLKDEKLLLRSDYLC